MFKHVIKASTPGSLNEQMDIDRAFLVRVILPTQDLLAILRAMVVCWPKGRRRIEIYALLICGINPSWWVWLGL